MYRFVQILCLFLLLSAKLSAQSTQQYLVYGSYMYYINNTDVSTSLGSKRFMSSPNNGGYNLGIAYEYKNKKNISFTGTLGYGMQTTDIKWSYVFDQYFDPRTDLSGYELTYWYRFKTQFINTSFLIGYDYALPKNKQTTIQVQAGIGSMRLLKFDEQYTQHVALYSISKQPASADSIVGTQYMKTNVQSGTRAPWWSGRDFYYTCYIGLNFHTKGKFVKNYKAGVSYTQAIRRNGDYIGYAESIYYHYDNGKVVADGMQRYNNTFRSLSATLAFGF